jgi:uncharacterized membrane protein
MVRVVLLVVGFASVVNYFVNNAVFNYFLSGIGVVIVGVMFLVKSVPVFIPFKQQIGSKGCPCCGAILKEDATVCEKCKQQITDN